MKRPDVEAVLAPLKGFQRRTVDHAFHRLFVAPDSAHRFLVADEVGLGKTLVARGIIARAIDHLWDDVDRIDIIYICSNGSIARQNLDKLQVSGSGERSLALATRLTMLATELARTEGRRSIADSKLNFVSFTPRTSFDMGHGTGRWRERQVLFHMVLPHVHRWIPLANLLQGNIGNHTWWRQVLQNESIPIEAGVRRRFDRRFAKDDELCNELDRLLNTWFFRHRQDWPASARSHRNRFLGRLRRLLAEVCVDGLEPDLVILDEFQRFKGLLETRPDRADPAAELAQALFNARTPEGNPVRTLLLSATPYKLYTADAEIEHEDHYTDFLGTTRFLMGGDDHRVADLRARLTRFGGLLKRAAAGADADVVKARDAVQDVLRGVMARTERVASTERRDAMVEEPLVRVSVKHGDIRQYLAADDLFRAVGDRDPMVYWKAAPYLLHFMHGYRFNRRLSDTLATEPDRVSDALRRHAPALLTRRTLEGFRQLDPAHGKLRELLADVIGGGMWRLLWMPPTVPYWPLAGPFSGQERRTKSLVFSAWNVVPNVVSAVVSYEVERRMVAGIFDRYADPTAQQRPLLRLADTAGRKRSNHRGLLLLLPCLTLADECHPLRAPAGADRVAWVRRRVRELLADLPNPTDGEVDRRWQWMLPLLLDPGLRDFLRAWRDDTERHRPNKQHFNDYVDDLLAVRPEELGARPPGLDKLAVDLTLGAPGVLAARTLLSAGIDNDTRRRLAVEVAEAFWSLFNRPAVIAMLRSSKRGGGGYWRAVLRYCVDGNLQAVLDETWHLLHEQHTWSVGKTEVQAATETARELANVVKPLISRVQAQLLNSARGGGVDSQMVRIRTDLAMRFGDAQSDDQEQADGEHRKVGQDGLRAAFNSPFRPFILASTSVGQEGLDFHPWCHRLVHWNLPGNPVDMEQREGRVHRYKGHAVRRNLAARHADAAMQAWKPGDDVWQRLFERADRDARQRQDSDLVPFWIAAGPFRVQRRVPLLPWTREVEAFALLKRQLAAYRVVFGQPRQEELLRLLTSSGLDTRTLHEWMIDLRPPAVSADALAHTSGRKR